MARPLYIVGDVHGQYKKALRLLEQNHLIDENENWIGGDARLWFTGDFFDRGSDSLAAVDLAMRLQAQARAAGGDVGALLGNHEILFLAAKRFEKHPQEFYFMLGWLSNGGVPSDLTKITDEQLAWLQSLPSMVLIDDVLLMHADATFYTEYGNTVEAVNHTIHDILSGSNNHRWDKLLDRFSQRFAFAPGNPEARQNIETILHQYGGQRIVHGHTPIIYFFKQIHPATVKSAFVYADDQCVDVDGGMYLGGEGFIYRANPNGKG